MSKYLLFLTGVGGWVVQKIRKTPLRNIKMAPKENYKQILIDV